MHFFCKSWNANFRVDSQSITWYYLWNVINQILHSWQSFPKKKNQIFISIGLSFVIWLFFSPNWRVWWTSLMMIAKYRKWISSFCKKKKSNFYLSWWNNTLEFCRIKFHLKHALKKSWFFLYYEWFQGQSEKKSGLPYSLTWYIFTCKNTQSCAY